MPVIDVARRQLGRRTQGLIGVLDAVVRFKTPLEPAQDANGVFNRRLGHVDFLEATRQGTVFFENAAKLLEGGGADAADITRRQQWLEQVGGVHHPTGGRTGTNDGVDLVDEQDRLRAFFSSPSSALKRFSKSPRYLVPASNAPRSRE